MKKVSIIIPCYNHASFLEASVNSALIQDYPNLEVIICNDGSTDNSLEVANKLALNNPRVSVLTHENKGVVATRNEAVIFSKGDYILPLDADDFLASHDVVSAMVEKLEDSEAVLVFGNHQCFGQSSNLIKPQLGDISNLLLKSFISATSLYTRAIFDKVGGYAKNMASGFEDWDFAIKVASSGKIDKIDKTVFFYRVQQVSRDIEANKVRAFLFNQIVQNNSELYVQNIASIVSIFEKEIEKARKKRKNQNKIKKGLVLVIILQFLAILTLILY